MMNTTKTKNFLIERKKYLIALAAMFVFVCVAAFWPQSQVEHVSASEPVLVESIDVAEGVPPMSNRFREVALRINAALKDIKPADRPGYVQTHYPDLGPSIVSQLRDRGMIDASQEVSGISYFFGSLEEVTAQQADGDPVMGKISNQLIAVVGLVDADPVAVIVLCANGWLDFSDDALKDLDRAGTQHVADLTIEIQPGDSLISHMSFMDAIYVAELNGLPITNYPMDGEPVKITPDQARALESQTDSNRIVIPVFAGDEINVATWEYIPA